MSEWTFVCTHDCLLGREARWSYPAGSAGVCTKVPARSVLTLSVEGSIGLEEAAKKAVAAGWYQGPRERTLKVPCCSRECFDRREKQWHDERPARHAAWEKAMRELPPLVGSPWKHPDEPHVYTLSLLFRVNDEEHVELRYEAPGISRMCRMRRSEWPGDWQPVFIQGKWDRPKETP